MGLGLVEALVERGVQVGLAVLRLARKFDYFTGTVLCAGARAVQAEGYRLVGDQLEISWIDLDCRAFFGAARNQAQGAALDDYMVARISSFLKSYGEMRRGEEFVMRQVRTRARERVRWIAGVGMLALAFVVTPGILGRVRRGFVRSE